MKLVASIVVACAFAVASLSPAFAAKISKSEVSDILSERGYPVSDFNSDMLRVDVGGYTILIWVDGADADISYITFVPGVSGAEVSYSLLNKFNNEVKFGRAYIDRDGDVAIQMDRNSAGGVSAENIESDFDVFLLLIAKFLSDLESQTVA